MAKRILIILDDEKHRAFKEACTNCSNSMQEILERLIDYEILTHNILKESRAKKEEDKS